MLDIPSLKDLAAKKLEAALKSKWDPTGFAGVVTEVYATSNTRDSDIREMLIKSAKSHLKELLLLDVFKDVLFSNAEFSGGLIVVGGLVAEAVVAPPPILVCRTCSYRNVYCRNCGTTN